jgi:beta propeller repeat protein
MDYRNGNYDIYMYDLLEKKEVPICTDKAYQGFPQIYGNYIVWMDYRNGNWDIYMYDLTSGKEIPICTDKYDQMYPAISGDYIVWMDNRNGNWDIYGFDLVTGTEIPICTESHHQGYPAVYADTIVAQDYRYGYWEIFAYDPSGGEKELYYYYDIIHPSISGGNVVGMSWQWWSALSWDIMLWDGYLGDWVPICVEPHDQMYPAIYKNRVVWMDNRNGNWDIYMREY